VRGEGLIRLSSNIRTKKEQILSLEGARTIEKGSNKPDQEGKRGGDLEIGAWGLLHASIIRGIKNFRGLHDGKEKHAGKWSALGEAGTPKVEGHREIYQKQVLRGYNVKGPRESHPLGN